MDSILPPCQRDHSYRAATEHTIVNIVVLFERVFGIVNHERASQTVAILNAKVAVVPERTCERQLPIRTEPHGLVCGAQLTRLVSSGEVIQERVPRSNRTLAHERGTVSPVRALLEEAVPMLSGTDITLAIGLGTK